MATFVKEKWGIGRPLQRLEMAQVPCFIMFLFMVLMTSSLRFTSPFCSKTKSRLCGESPAILPIAHKAYSATMGYLLFNSFTNKGMPPKSIMVWVCVVVPEATLVSAHAASSYK